MINNMAQPLMSETVWYDKCKYDEAEKRFEEEAAQQRKTGQGEQSEKPKSSLAEEIANARQHILNTLQSGDIHLRSSGESKDNEALSRRYDKIEKEMVEVRKEFTLIQSQMQALTATIALLLKDDNVAPKVVKEVQTVNSMVNNHTGDDDDDDDDVDLFNSDEEDEAAIRLKEERVKAYQNKKSKKAPLVAKSSVVLDIKPWDDETDMKEMEVRVKEVECDGLKWGAHKLVPLAYGIKKLQIVCIVEDDKVSIDWLQETIQEKMDDLVQSVDIAAFNKL